MFSTVPKRLAVPRRFILKQAQQCNKKRKRVIWHIHRKPQLTTIITPHPSTAMIVAEETYHVKQTHTHWSTCPPSPYNNNMDINSIATLYTTPTCTDSYIKNREESTHQKGSNTCNYSIKYACRQSLGLLMEHITAVFVVGTLDVHRGIDAFGSKVLYENSFWFSPYCKESKS